MRQQQAADRAKLFDTHGLSRVTTSSDGRYVAATDVRRYFYLFDSSARKLVYERQQTHSIVEFHFDRAGSRLFLNDGVLLTALSAPAMQELEPVLSDALPEPASLRYLDSNVDGDLLILEEHGNRLFLQRASGASSLLATLPQSEIGAWFLGPARIVVSTFGSFGLSTILDINQNGTLDFIPPMTSWREAAVFAVADDARQALRWADQLIIADGAGSELSRCSLPAALVDQAWLIDPSLTAVAILAGDSLSVHDARTGSQLESTADTANPVNSIALFSQGDTAVLVCGLLNGEVVQRPVS